MSPRPTPVSTRKKPVAAAVPQPSGPKEPAITGRGSTGTRAGRTRAAKASSRRPKLTQSEPVPPAPDAATRRVIGASDRFQRHLFTWKRVFAALVVLGVVAATVWALFFSTVLTVKSVSVLGTTRQSPAAVRALLRPEVGRPLARVDLDVAAQRVVNLPTVQSVQVVRAWPNSLEVRVVERVPVAVVSTSGSYTLLDVEGIAMTTQPKPPADLPIMTQATLNAGTGPTRAVVESLDRLSPALRAQVRTAGAQSQDSVTFGLKSGATVKWGSAEDSDRKAEVLAVLLRLKAKMYDVSVPGTPVTK